MPGLVPGSHHFLTCWPSKTWMAGTGPAMTMTNTETRPDAVQFIPVHFPVPAGCPVRLFRHRPAQRARAGDLAGAGLAGVLLRWKLAVRAAAAGLDRLQLSHW